jgi:hypothetical protein
MKILIIVLLLGLLSCANKSPIAETVTLKTLPLEQTRKVSNDPESYDPELQVGDKVTLKFELDIVIEPDQSRAIYDLELDNYNRIVGYINQGSQKNTMSGDHQDFTLLRNSLIVDMKKKSKQARYIKKGQVVEFEVVLDKMVASQTQFRVSNIEPMSDLPALNNLQAPPNSEISRVILKGGALGTSFTSLSDLKSSAQYYFTFLKYSPIDPKKIPVQVQ